MAPSEQLRRIAGSPAAWHILTLVAGAASILALQSTQWFFFDDFAFIDPNAPGIWEPHVGHWSTTPALVFRLLTAIFGVDSYLPFALVITALHLGAVHLVWRIARRSGVNGWIATAAAAAFTFFGSGAENILWAFQIGYVGALVCGLAAFLLAWDDSGSRARFAATVAVSVFSLTWSGTAIPLVVATAAMVWWRQGWRRALIAAVVPAAVYLVWYAVAAAGIPRPAVDLGELGPAAVQFIGVLLILGVAAIFPSIVVGCLVVLCFVIWLVPTLRRREARVAAAAPLLLLGAAALFIVIAAVSRAEMSVGSGRSGRYMYLVVLLCVPILSYAVGRAAARFRSGVPVAVTVLLALGWFQLGLLITEAERQSAIEQQTHRLLSAALAIYRDDPDRLAPGASPDPRWAPDLVIGDLTLLYDRGLISIGEFDEDDVAMLFRNFAGG
jgi:hypothetical protein